MTQWKKVKIGDVCKIVKGTTGIASAKPGEYPLVVTAVERKTCSDYQFDCEAVCIPLVSSSGHGKKSLNNVHYQSGKFALGTILCAVIPNDPKELDARYLHQYLQFYKDTVLVPLMKGAANVSLSMKDIATVEIPLPPIERQRELSAMFISLQEKSRQLRVESEKQIEYAKQLRASILQDAIEGKLTADWREKHPVKKGNPDYDA
jgi:type I restriction enzyme S subunit